MQGIPLLFSSRGRQLGPLPYEQAERQTDGTAVFEP